MGNTIFKKVLIIGMFPLAFFVLKSDIIPENSHAVARTVVITNCSDFQNIQFVAYVDALVGDKEFYEIGDNQSLRKGYKFNRLFVFGIDKQKLKKIGGVDKLTKKYVFDRINPGEILSSATLYVDNSQLLEKEEIFYEMMKVDDEVFVAKLKTRTSHFSDNTKDTIEY